MYAIHMEKIAPRRFRPESTVHIFRAPDEPSAREIAHHLERLGGWALLKVEDVADSTPTPRRYRIRWRENAIGYVEV